MSSTMKKYPNFAFFFFLGSLITLLGLICVTKWVSTDPNDIHVLLFPSRSDKNLSVEIKLGEFDNLSCSGFRKGVKTVVLVHPYAAYEEVMYPMRDAYMEALPNRNYILVDWLKLSAPEGTPKRIPVWFGYYQTIKNIEIVGKRVAEVLDGVIKTGITDENSIHCVGFSLGAHACGAIGNHFKEMSGNKIGRITGLDPAGPFFHPVPFAHALGRDDAAFVDVIHTGGKMLGDMTEDGHADFWVNGGKKQPNCNDWDSAFALPGICSHVFALHLHGASFRKELMGCECPLPSSYFLKGKDNPCMRPCKNPVKVGEFCPKTAKGNYAVMMENPIIN